MQTLKTIKTVQTLNPTNIVRRILVRVPKFGADSITSAVIADWHVAYGQVVVPDQPIVTLETEKIDVLIRAERAGVVSTLYGKSHARGGNNNLVLKNGDTVDVDDPLYSLRVDIESPLPRKSIHADLA